MLQCYNVTMLQCYNVTMLQCYNVTKSAESGYIYIKQWCPDDAEHHC